MNQLDRTLILKKPATVVDARPIITLTAPYVRKADLIREVNRRAARREIRPLTSRASYNERTGNWEHRVVQLEPAAPAWIRPAMIVTVLLALLGALIGLGWWVFMSLATLPLGLFLLAALSALVVIVRLGRTPSVTVSQSVKIR